MIDPETMNQIRALSQQIQLLRVDLDLLSKKLDINNTNIANHMKTETGLFKDMAERADKRVAEFGGMLDDLRMEWTHFKTDLEWWKNHLDELSRRNEAQLVKMAQSSARLEQDNQTFQQWAEAKIQQIGRIFRR